MPLKSTTLPRTIQAATPGLLGFDVNAPMTAANLQAFKKEGYAFCMRYLPRTAALLKGNLTNAEALTILNAGLTLMPVQHVSLPGWHPTTNLGTQYETFAASYAKEIGLPAGINVWCDLEGVATGTPPANVIAYCQAWYNVVHAAGYVPGIYVGYDTMLTPQQLYDDISFQHYWRTYNGPQVATRGFQLLQKTEKTLNGVTFDPDVTQHDGEGDSVLWLQP